MLGYKVVSNHFDPPYRQPMSLDTEAHLSPPSVPPHLYTMRDTGCVHAALDLRGSLGPSERFTQTGCASEGVQPHVPS